VLEYRILDSAFKGEVDSGIGIDNVVGRLPNMVSLPCAVWRLRCEQESTRAERR
jgi:hypothetical protein